ncbi:MAG: hypothetical protein H6868_10410 [Rhodospirillales bacterium]|nr:hypothetical protein [Rhodospirillales bacterium]
MPGPSLWHDNIAADHEPHKVLIARDELIDPARDNRIVPIKIYYPVAHSLNHLPVIVWSHGLGGSRDGAAFIGRFLASHGYAVVHVQHAGTDLSLWQGKPGHPWDAIRAAKISGDDVKNRYRDIPFVLDSLPAWIETHPDVGEHMNLGIMGMSGHSFGANTTQVMAGQLFGKTELQSLYEPRFKAGIAYSPIPTVCKLAPESEIYGAIKLPLLHMTGTADESPIEGYGAERRFDIFNLSGGPDQHMLILEDGDHMVFAGSRGKLADNPKRKLHEDIIKISSLAFWDSYLREDNAAREWLTGNAFQNWLGAEAKYRFRP